MAGAGAQSDLFPDAATPEGPTVVTDRCLVRTQHGHRVVIVAGVVLAQYAVGDQMAEAYAMVSLGEQGWADQNDVARAFDRSARSLRRYERRFATGGLAAETVRTETEWIGWELFGNRALRQGDWKLLNTVKGAGGTGEWQLFKLSTDPGETRDLAKDNPAKLKELVALWNQYAKQNGVILTGDGPFAKGQK